MKNFLMTVSNLEQGQCGRLPPGAYMDAGWLLYAWSTGRKTVDGACRAAAKRCLALRERTGLDWCVDHDMHDGCRTVDVSRVIAKEVLW